MSKGTPSFGKHKTITHIRCRRCGRHSYNIRKSFCAACGFGKSSKLSHEKFKWKAPARKKRKY
jgi:large subunit ribosomal protein L37e